MEITLNGKSENLDSSIELLEDLINHFALGNQRIAVEINGEIIPRSSYQETKIQSNDQIEIIKAVGGG